ncbi:MAG: ATP-dependent sacrificial sulfur transferase LarE [Actinobacteria bacterium]|nr:ATP-dependent sacrificial sulfur transferase LarE [Actinomycetota bacterium]
MLPGLVERVRGYGHARALVAFSGGVDSAVVLAVAARALAGDAVTAVTAVSPSYPAGELEAAREVARGVGVAHRTVATHEVERDAYARNDGLRCFHCKTELYSTLGRIAMEETGNGTVVLAGANADDALDVRPGLLAAERQGVRNPLLEAGVGKAETRALARWLGLPVADKPALACLSSRVVHGIRITPALLARIDRAERAVRALGFDQVRVRHLGDTASIEVPSGDVARLIGHPGYRRAAAALRTMGWERVAVDPSGYRQGSLNPAGASPRPRGYSP